MPYLVTCPTQPGSSDPLFAITWLALNRGNFELELWTGLRIPRDGLFKPLTKRVPSKDASRRILRSGPVLTAAPTGDALRRGPGVVPDARWRGSLAKRAEALPLRDSNALLCAFWNSLIIYMRGFEDLKQTCGTVKRKLGNIHNKRQSSCCQCHVMLSRNETSTPVCAAEPNVARHKTIVWRPTR